MQKMRIGVLALGLFMATMAGAQKFSDGTYVIPDSGYSITVIQKGDSLIVVEPNKTSEYRPQGNGAYHFLNNVNGILYGLRVIDAQTIEAFKPGGSAPATRLTRLGGAPKANVTVDAAPTPGPHFEIAERYKARALAEPIDAQTWAFCSAAALKRSMATKEDADAYGREAAVSLSTILVDPANRPCNDAIPPELWPAPAAQAKADAAADKAFAERAALARANAEVRDAAARQATEIAALKQKQVADLAAYERAKANHAAALAKSAAEQSAFAQQQEAYRAAMAEHARQTGLRRKGGGQ